MVIEVAWSDTSPGPGVPVTATISLDTGPVALGALVLLVSADAARFEHLSATSLLPPGGTISIGTPTAAGSVRVAAAGLDWPVGSLTVLSVSLRPLGAAGESHEFGVTALEALDRQGRRVAIPPAVAGVTVAAGPPVPRDDALPRAQLGVPYHALMRANGGTAPLVWSLTTGTLPPGLTLTEDGRIHGTPNVTGSSAVTVGVTDATGAVGQRAVTLVTVEAPPVVALEHLPTAVPGQPYTASLAVNGGRAPMVWSATGLPAGLAVSGATIAGTPHQLPPDELGVTSIHLEVTDALHRHAEATVLLSVLPEAVVFDADIGPLSGVAVGRDLIRTRYRLRVWGEHQVPPRDRETERQLDDAKQAVLEAILEATGHAGGVPSGGGGVGPGWMSIGAAGVPRRRGLPTARPWGSGGPSGMPSGPDGMPSGPGGIPDGPGGPGGSGGIPGPGSDGGLVGYTPDPDGSSPQDPTVPHGWQRDPYLAWLWTLYLQFDSMTRGGGKVSTTVTVMVDDDDVAEFRVGGLGGASQRTMEAAAGRISFAGRSTTSSTRLLVAASRLVHRPIDRLLHHTLIRRLPTFPPEAPDPMLGASRTAQPLTVDPTWERMRDAGHRAALGRHRGRFVLATAVTAGVAAAAAGGGARAARRAALGAGILASGAALSTIGLAVNRLTRSWSDLVNRFDERGDLPRRIVDTATIIGTRPQGTERDPGPATLDIEVELTPGAHTVGLRWEGYVVTGGSVQAANVLGTSVRLTLRLDPIDEDGWPRWSGSSTVEASGSYAGGEAIRTVSLATSDVDVIVARPDGTLRLWAARGDGTFAGDLPFPGAGVRAQGPVLLTGVLDEHGRTSLAATAGDGVLLLLNDGVHGFRARNVPLGGVPFDLTWSDLRADGRHELVASVGGAIHWTSGVREAFRASGSTPSTSARTWASLVRDDRPTTVLAIPTSTGDDVLTSHRSSGRLYRMPRTADGGLGSPIVLDGASGAARPWLQPWASVVDDEELVVWVAQRQGRRLLILRPVAGHWQVEGSVELPVRPRVLARGGGLYAGVTVAADGRGEVLRVLGQRVIVLTTTHGPPMIDAAAGLIAVGDPTARRLVLLR